MSKIEYKYCVDRDNSLVCIDDITDENRCSYKENLFCLQCGKEMTAKLGNIKVHHFAHKVNTACNGESYLHKLAKRRIKEKFDTSDRFPIIFKREVPCKDSKSCQCFDRNKSYSDGCYIKDQLFKIDLKEWNGRKVYDTCEEEVHRDDYIADLLLTNSDKPNIKPVFIEIFVKHKSTDEKINSEYKIIETAQIKTEDDIDSIITDGFREGKNCTLYNFEPKMPFVKLYSRLPVDRFVLFKNESTCVIPDIKCNLLMSRLKTSSIIELNINHKGRENKWLFKGMYDSFKLAAIYLYKRGVHVKSCSLCKYYKYNSYYFDEICICYKSLNLQSRKPKLSTALSCAKYVFNQELLSVEMSELEEIVSEVE